MDVDRERPFPERVVHLRNAGAALGHGSVVDQEVEAAERVHGGGDDVAALLGGFDVAGQQEHPPAGLTHPFGGRLGVGLLLGQVRQGNVGALAGVGDGHRPADAGVAAGDQSPPAGQPTGAAVGALTMVGFGEHGDRAARERLRLRRERRLRVDVTGILHERRHLSGMGERGGSGRWVHRQVANILTKLDQPTRAGAAVHAVITSLL